MAQEVERKIAKIEVMLEDIKEDITEIKEELKNTPTRESVMNLEMRVKKVEDNQSKLVWLVVAAVVAEILKSVFVK